MKTQQFPHHRLTRSGFSLLELLIVIAIMALLASLTMYGFRYANIMSKRQHTTAYQRAIQSGLERYNTENGDFPQAKNTQQTAQFQGQTLNVSGAKMLYQALSGDGDSEIKLGTSSNTPSDGKFTDIELQRIMLKEMPPQMWLDGRKSPNGYMLIDGFARPFQYLRVDFGGGAVRDPQGRRTSAEANVPTINPTYDLWSFAEDVANTSRVDIQSRTQVKNSAAWIKNW
jgi:prepilin-type N-terminal cleavage/methylation domain-containing protein